VLNPFVVFPWFGMCGVVHRHVERLSLNASRDVTHNVWAEPLVNVETTTFRLLPFQNRRLYVASRIFSVAGVDRSEASTQQLGVGPVPDRRQRRVRATIG